MILCLNSVFGTIMDISCGNMFTTMLKVKKLYTMQFRSVLALAKLLSCFARLQLKLSRNDKSNIGTLYRTL